MRIDDNSLFHSSNTGRLVNISELKSGDVFRAEIMDIKQSEMLLKLLGTDTTLNAKTTKLMGLKIGEFVNFKVTSSNQGHLVLEPILNEQNNVEAEVIHNTIKNNNLPDNNLSNELVKKLFESSMPLVKENMINLYQLIKQNPKLDVDKLMVLLNNNIPITESNIYTLNSIANGNNMLNKEIDVLLNKLVEKDIPETNKYIAEFITNTDYDYKVMDKNLYNKLEKKVDGYVDEIVLFSKDASKSMGVPFEEVTINIFKTIGSIDDENLKNTIIDDISKNIKLFSKVIVNKFKISIQENNLENISNSYKILYEFVSKLSTDMEVDTVGADILNSASKIKQSIEFMNGLLNYDTYIQLPIRRESLKNNPELYILKNNKKARKSLSISALLCLDLVNLGYTEILINKSGNNVSFKFKITIDKTINLISKNVYDLKRSLQEKGINTVSLGYESISEKSNILNVKKLLSNDDKDDEPKIYSFDIRV